MKEKISKRNAEERIDKFFLEIKSKSPKEIKKIKKLAMNQRISLKNKKELFCKKCLKPYINPRIRIKSRYKILICENCDSVKRIMLS